MSKIKKFIISQKFTIIFFNSFLLFSFILNFSNDTLLWYSDFHSLWRVIFYGTLICSIPVCGIYFMIFKNRENQFYASTFAFFLSFITIFLLESVFLPFYFKIIPNNWVLFKIFNRVKKILDEPHYFLLCFSFCFFCSLFFLKRNTPKDRECIFRRIQFLSRFVFVVFLVITGMIFLPEIEKSKKTYSNKDTSAKHMILIVIDGFPAYLTKFYNKDLISDGSNYFDDVAKQGLSFTRAYTNKPYTSGYFGVLYSGNLSSNFKNKSSILNFLQDNNVRTRVINFHSNGIPECNGISDYRGLRSVFLSEDFSKLMEKLGFKDYNIFLKWKNNRSYLSKRTQWLFNILFDGNLSCHKSNWSEILANQIKEIRSQTNRSFIILHVNTGTVSTQTLEKNEIGSNDYIYNKENEKFVELQKRKYKERINFHGHEITRFINFLKKEKLFDNTTLIITADHGTTFENKKIWYGFHPTEEVIRVPLVIINNNILKKQESNPVDTLDLHETIKSFFSLSYNADRNILDIKKDKLILNLTLESHKRNEQFLNIINKDKKYSINIKKNLKKNFYIKNFIELEISEEKIATEEIEKYLKEFGVESLL